MDYDLCLHLVPRHTYPCYSDVNAQSFLQAEKQKMERDVGMFLGKVPCPSNRPYIAGMNFERHSSTRTRDGQKEKKKKKKKSKGTGKGDIHL